MRLKPEIYTPPGSRFLQGLATKSKHAIAVTGLSIFLGAMAWGAEIRFTTLPEVVRTTVIHETGILGPDKVVRVVRVADDIYEITVLTDTGQRVLYVTEDGTIVQRPGVAVDEGSTSDSEEVTITMDEIQRGGDRYRFVEDQGPDKVYIDTQSNKRVIVKNESTNVNENRRSVRGHEGTNEQNVTRERNQIGSQKNDENVKEQNGATRSNQENMRREQNTENKGAGQGERNPEMQNNQGQNNQRQNKEGSNSKMGTEERPGAGRNTKGEMSPNESRGTTNQQEQKGAQRGQGKEKASPTP
jgi:hypothetical protein